MTRVATLAEVPSIPAVQPALLGNCGELTEALAAAFEDDPVFSFLVPDGRRRARCLRRFFAIETRHVALPHGQSLAAADGSAAALVLPPGEWRTSLPAQARHGPGYFAAFGRALPRALGVLTKLERHHIRVPHIYFAYIGVAPAAQGRGLGAALMRPVLERCDDDGIAAYLEASSPRSAALYERLGFVTREEIRPLGSPPILLMLRSPRA